MSYIAGLVASTVAAYGEACVLKRAGQTDLPVMAKRLMKSRKGGDGIVNSFDDADLLFEISNAELAAAPSWGLPVRTDVLLGADGITYAVLHVDTRYHEGVVVKHNLWVSG